MGVPKMIKVVHRPDRPWACKARDGIHSSPHMVVLSNRLATGSHWGLSGAVVACNGLLKAIPLR